MARILVTGGAGYIGAHGCKALRAAGHEPIVFDNFRTGWRDAVKFGEMIEGDLLDLDALKAAFAQAKPEAVMHFAALSNVGESMADPELYWRNNVGGSLNLLTAMRDAGVGSIVFSSTAATYGEPDEDPITETARQAPINPYGASKLAVEKMLDDFEKAHGIRSIAFRYFNVAGADPERQVGEHHVPETHLVPNVLDSVAGARDALTINGTDYPTPDGTCIRDYVHVMDLVDAHVLGTEWLLAGKESLRLNLGTGSGFSVREVVDAASEVVGETVPMNYGPRRPGDPARLVCDGTRAREVLGWSPERSVMAQMIGDAWAWRQTGRYSR
ncbi:UDP-galactose 4-epimerase [Albimonas donghaensis]|uniref:UDP-glucose 4-epimerase n=1 Tax=Albimonas donghaensis TaxID=356660 RepID=A0A1H2TSU3_9RHOB|nr:UDP-glucose 4-epimerase GalE [Albimonas donghaensis]MAS42642.1 UDP-glucose 4-epimerase GalE [Paracoccaceae bacterium]MBR28973.1 UDP-glucose 4-epimerase GalE [Paracoccaceae bacterium]SDW46942.1 UDP-galactose 4-epimerase [Albimonas donghaensis]